MQQTITTTLTSQELVGLLKGAIREALDGEGGKKKEVIPITRRELGDKLGIGENTIMKLERQGIIPAIRLGGTIRYDYEEVLEALKNHRLRKRTGKS